MKKVYKVIINGKVFVRTSTSSLAERTLKMAENYGLTGEIIEAFEEYNAGAETI